MHQRRFSAENPAGVAELADAQDLGSCTERCRGSTPLSCSPIHGQWKMGNGKWKCGLSRFSICHLFLPLSIATSACADTLWIGSGSGGAIQVSSATILRVDKDRL